MSKISSSIKESYAELKHKVAWPTWAQLQSSAVLVMVASAIFAVVVFAMDFSFEHIMGYIYTLLY